MSNAHDPEGTLESNINLIDLSDLSDHQGHALGLQTEFTNKYQIYFTRQLEGFKRWMDIGIT